MSDDPLRDVWVSAQSIDEEALRPTMKAVLDEDRAARARERRVSIATVIVLALLCPMSIWFAAYGKTPLIRGAYALMGAGTAIYACVVWLCLAWSRQAFPGPAAIRAHLQTTAVLLSRQANVFRTAALWCAPIFVSAVLVGLWIYQERSHTEGDVLWVTTGVAWVISAVSGVAKGQKINQRRLRVERILSDLG